MSKYYICTDCGSTGIWSEAPKAGGTLYQPEYYICPNCESDCLSDAEECLMCGVIENGEFSRNCLCMKCQDKVETEINSVIDMFVRRAVSEDKDTTEEELKDFINSIL